MSTTKTPGTLQGIVLILPVVLSVMGAVLLAPIVPQLMAQFGDVPNARYWVPTLLSVPALCIALFSPLAGYFADRMGRRRLLIISMFIYAGFGLAPLLLDNFYAIYATRIGVGICEAVVMTASTTLIGDYFKGGDRDKWLGSQAATASLTAMFLFPIAGALGLISWRGPFALYSLSLVLVVGVMLFTWEPERREPVKASRSIDKPVQPFPWRRMLEICAISLVGAVMFYVLQFQLSSALQHFDVQSTLTSGVLLSVASLAVPMGAIFYRFAHKKLSLIALVTLEFSLLAIGFFGMSHAPNYQTLVAAGFLNQFGAGMLLPTMLTWAMAQLAFENRGRGTGMWQSTFAFGQFASTLAFAAAASAFGGIFPAFQVFSGVALAMAIGAGILLFRSGTIRPAHNGTAEQV